MPDKKLPPPFTIQDCIKAGKKSKSNNFSRSNQIRKELPPPFCTDESVREAVERQQRKINKDSQPSVPAQRKITFDDLEDGSWRKKIIGDDLEEGKIPPRRMIVGDAEGGKISFDQIEDLSKRYRPRQRPEPFYQKVISTRKAPNPEEILECSSYKGRKIAPLQAKDLINPNFKAYVEYKAPPLQAKDL